MAAAVLGRPSTFEPGLDNGARFDLSSPKPFVWSGMATATSPPAAPVASRRSLSTPSKAPALEAFTFDDPIHGPWRIESPCLLTLLAHPSFRRLQHVLQHGITALMKLTPEPPETRWEHSIGAMIAVGKAGGSEEAMISALLHDVAHTALSHVADQAYGRVVHEDDKDEFLAPSGLLEILEDHGFDPAHVLHEENFSLLELPSPAICADRFDYGLRDSVNFHTLSLANARSISDAMTSYTARTAEGREEAHMGFPSRHLDRALVLARAYVASDSQAWANGKHTWLYHLAADAIRHADQVDRTITKRDLWWPRTLSNLPDHAGGGDASFWQMLWERGSQETRRRWAEVHKDYEVEELSNGDVDGITANGEMEVPAEVVARRKVAEGVDVFTARIKSRVLDPDIIFEGNEGGVAIRKLSEVVPEWKEEMERHVRTHGGTRRFRIRNLRV